MHHFIQIDASDRAAIIDALYRFGAGQDLHDRALFLAFAILTRIGALGCWVVSAVKKKETDAKASRACFTWSAEHQGYLLHTFDQPPQLRVALASISLLLCFINSRRPPHMCPTYVFALILPVFPHPLTTI